jgi:hypothetical protein
MHRGWAKVLTATADSQKEGVGVTSVIAPVCVECKHFRPSDDGMSCDAFPRGIPDRVILDGDPHTGPLPGDHGIRFEPDRRRPARGRTPSSPTRNGR